MTIVFLARRFYPLIGGVEKHVFEISRRLVQRGHKVIVITEIPNTVIPAKAGIQKRKARIRDSWFAARNDKIEGIEIIRIPSGNENWFKKFRLWQEMWKLREVIRQADVIHCHDVFFWYLPFRFLYPKKTVYTTFHGYESYPIKPKAIRMRKLSEKLSWGNICIGDFIPKWYGTKPTFVSYGAVDIPSSVIARRNDEAIPSYMRLLRSARNDENNASALFIGRLDEQTGIQMYHDAVKKLRKEYPKFQFCVIGDGNYKKKLDKKTKVLGFLENPEKYFPKYHFAFVSRYLAILEAFAAKRLVFAVYDDPIKEDYLKLAPFTNYIVTVDDTDQLAKKVKFYIDHPDEESKLIEKAYKWVQKQTWEAMVELYLHLWLKKTIR